MSGARREGQVGVFRRAADGRRVAACADRPGDPHGPRAPDQPAAWCSPARWTACGAAPIAARRSSARISRTRASRSGRSWSMPRNAERIYAGGSPVDVYRSDDSGESWRRLPNPGIKERATAPFAVARHAHGAAPDAARRDLRGAGGQRRHPHHRWRRDLGGLQRRPDPPVGAAASQEQDRQRHLRRRHARRARHRHQPGRPRRGGPRLPHGPVPHAPTRAGAGRTWR